MNKEIKLKICGITNLVDRDTVIAWGADYFGAILEVPQSPRSIDVNQAAVIFNTRDICKVAVLVNPDEKAVLRVAERLRPTAVQLHGNESTEFVAKLKDKIHCEIWKALSVPVEITNKEELLKELNEKIRAYVQAGVSAIVLDAKIRVNGKERSGGTGKSFDWLIIRELDLPAGVKLFVSGGVRPENVAELLAQEKISGIDIGSGVELFPGKKDPVKLRKLLAEIQKARSG